MLGRQFNVFDGNGVDEFQQNQPVFFFGFAHYAKIKISQLAIGSIFIARQKN